MHQSIRTKVNAMMCRTTFLLGMLALLGFPCIRGFAAESPSRWDIQIVHKDLFHWSGGVSLALDKAGRPHITYYEDPAGRVNYAYWNGTSWQIEVVEENVGGFEGGPDTSIAVDAAGRPHVSYSDYSDRTLRYAYREEGSWRIEEIVDDDGVGGEPSLALDTQGRPHIAYSGYETRLLKYAFHDGENWHIEIVDEERPVLFRPPLVLDANDWPHIAYGASLEDDLMYAHYDGVTWRIETVDSDGEVGLLPSLGLDAAGHPHIGHVNVDTRHLEYAHYDGGAWHFETADSSGGTGEVSLALGADGHPRISYSGTSGLTHHNVKYTYYDGESWHLETLEHVGFYGGDPSLALDATGQPCIAYFDNGWYDDTEGGIKFARPIGSLPLPGTGSGAVSSWTWVCAGVMIGFGAALRTGLALRKNAAR